MASGGNSGFGLPRAGRRRDYHRAYPWACDKSRCGIRAWLCLPTRQAQATGAVPPSYAGLRGFLTWDRQEWSQRLIDQVALGRERHQVRAALGDEVLEVRFEIESEPRFDGGCVVHCICGSCESRSE